VQVVEQVGGGRNRQPQKKENPARERLQKIRVPVAKKKKNLNEGGKERSKKKNNNREEGKRRRESFFLGKGGVFAQGQKWPP